MKYGLEDFRGLWCVTRQIDDRHSGQVGSFHGTVTFGAGVAGALLYHEAGKMRLGSGPEMSAERRYRWQFEENKVRVTFDDGAPFHSFVPHGLGNGTDHPCGEDFYRVAYDFRGWPEWQATWTVTGPRKDYTMVSRYHRP